MLTVVYLMATTRLHSAAIELAQAVPDANPTLDGLPGAGLIQKALDWAAGVTLATTVIGIVIGGAIWAIGAKRGSLNWSDQGKTYIFGGVAAAVVVALAPTIVTTAYNLAGTP